MQALSGTERLKLVHSALVNKSHGIITSLIEENNHHDAPGLFVFNGLTVEAGYFCENKHGRRQDARNGSGAAFDRASAMWASFGEALERYAAFVPDRTRFVLASEMELGADAVPLADFILFGAGQYANNEVPFAAPARNLPRNWVRAVDLCRQVEKFVPAVAVYLGVRLDHEHENIIQNTSSGLSCAASFDAAVQGGLCEVLERDAFASMWQLMARPPSLRIEDEALPLLDPGVRRALRNRSVPIHLWSITADTGIPVIMAMADSVHDGRIAFGSCANPDLKRAVNKAVVEALHGLVWSNRVRNRGKPPPTRDEIVNPGDHFAHYLEPSRRQCLDFLFEPGVTVSFSELAQRHPTSTLEHMLEHLEGLGKSVFTVDVTTDDVADLDLRVVRTIVPGLQPLLFGGNLISRDERRLRELSRHWGLAAFPEPNPAPHPFP
jgi:ribosomal protein S12 methylthiotransferase accessory factor